MRDASPSAPFRQRLLPTAPEALPPGVEAAARSLCEESASGVDAAYLCLVSVEATGCDPTTQLELGVKLRRPQAPTDIDHSLARPISTGLSRDARFARQVRLAILAERAVDAWASHGVQVFPAPK